MNLGAIDVATAKQNHSILEQTFLELRIGIEALFEQRLGLCVIHRVEEYDGLVENGGRVIGVEFLKTSYEFFMLFGVAKVPRCVGGNRQATQRLVVLLEATLGCCQGILEVSGVVLSLCEVFHGRQEIGDGDQRLFELGYGFCLLAGLQQFSSLFKLLVSRSFREVLYLLSVGFSHTLQVKHEFIVRRPYGDLELLVIPDIPGSRDVEDVDPRRIQDQRLERTVVLDGNGLFEVGQFICRVGDGRRWQWVAFGVCDLSENSGLRSCPQR